MRTRTTPIDRFEPVPPPVPGLDPALDATLGQYAQRCFAEDLQACDDLFYESPPMSEYERYGATCGGRVKPFAVAACTDLGG